MPSWSRVLEELQNTPSPFDGVRRKYLRRLQKHTSRNIIAYYSAWLQKQPLQARGVSFALEEIDKGGFMTAISGLDRSLGLDLVLHTPGGSITALEGLVHYLRQMFGKDIRAIVPQIAMSAGTMLALSCRQIIMGKHSSLGPIDPQVGGMAAHELIEEATRARNEIHTNPVNAAIWQPILAKYPPTLLGVCEKAIKLSENLVAEWLQTGMFENEPDPGGRAESIVRFLGRPSETLTHDRRISAIRATELGINVFKLEDDPQLQDLVLSVHDAFTQTLSETPVIRLIENHNGIAFMLNHREAR